MSTLSFSIRAHSWEIETLDLPVEVRRLDLEVQARGMVSDTLEVPPGTYMAVSHLPAGQELRAQVTVGEGETREVTLEPNAWERSPHESEEVPRFVWGYTPAPPDTDLDAEEKHEIQTPDLVAHHGLQGFVRVGGVAEYAPAPFQPQLDPRPGPTRMRFPPWTELDLLRVEQRGRDPAHIVLPSVRETRVPGHASLMVGEDAGCTVVLLPAADGTVDCEVHLLDLKADTMLQYLVRGMIAEASVMAANVEALAEQLVEEKLANPVAAAAGAYVLLRLGALERLHDWTENLFNWFPSLPDGAAARGEHLARAGRHEEAAERFLALEDRGLPTMSDGLGYAVQRLELYAATRPDPVADQCRRLLEQLLPFAAATDFTEPFTTFVGRSPNEPGALSREHATREPTDKENMPADAGYKEPRAIPEAAREKDRTLPSFGKGLYLGDFQPELISPQPELAPEAVEKGERFLAALSAFLQNEVDPQAIERDGRISDEVVAGLKEIGALGMKVPEQYGGLGLSQVYYNRSLGLAGTWHSSLSTLLSAHQSIGVAQPLLLFGSEEQKREWLPKVCTTHLSAFALAEPGVGSDPARVSTTATPTEDGTGYVLNGRKLWTTNGTIADVLVVLAKVPRSEGRRGGITAFIVPSTTEGVVVEARIEFMGLRGIENSQTRYTDAFVPSENVIGREGQGLKIALATLNTGRLALPAVCAGISKWATKIAREFASQRVQWGKPIGEHDEVAQRIAFIAATAFGLEAMVDVTSRLADEKRNDVRIEAAIAKLYGSEMGWRVVDELMQVCGGRGYETAASLQARGLRGVPVEQTLRDMRVNRIFEGSTEIMHLIIAREAVDQHLKVAGDLMESDVATADKAKALGRVGAFYAGWYPRLAVGRGNAPRSYAAYGELAGHMRFVERTSRKLARSTFYGMARWQAYTENHGAFLGRIVDIGAELFAIAAAVVYAQTAIREHPERAAETRELADTFCQQATLRTDRLFHQLWSNADTPNHRLALDVLKGRHTWLETGILDPSFGDGPMVPSTDTDRGAPIGRLANTTTPPRPKGS